VTSDGQFLISSGSTGVKVRQLSTGKMVKSLESAGNNHVPSKVIVTQQGQVLSKGIGTGKGLDVGFIKVWQLATGKRLQTIQHGPGDGYWGFKDMVVSPNGKTLITGSNNTFGDDNIRVYRLSTGDRVGDLASGRFAVPAVRQLAITPDGKTLIAFDQEVWLWDVSTGKLLHRLAGQGITMISVSPNGRWLIGAGDSLQLWELSIGKLIHTWNIQSLTKEESSINEIAISPDGKTLATADGNKIRLWTLSTSL
jgi:WD40 repeat protein